MPDTPNTDRERFEQFHGQRRSKGAGWRERMFARLPDETYADESVQRHWWTWQNALEAQAAELARLRAERVPDCVIADNGYRWDSERQHHVPQVLVEFDPVPGGSPADAKGWRDRDAFASMLASPQPPAQPAPPSADARDGERLAWLMRHLPGRALRDLIGEMAWTGDIDEFRAAIDAAAGKGDA